MYKYLANCLVSADTMFIIKYLVVSSASPPPPYVHTCRANLCGNYQHSGGSARPGFDPKIFIKISIVCLGDFSLFPFAGPCRVPFVWCVAYRKCNVSSVSLV